MVSINKKKCTGCGACASLAPKCFAMGSDGKAKVKAGCNCDDDCKSAKESCPVDAIS